MWLRSVLLCVMLGGTGAWAARDVVVDPETALPGAHSVMPKPGIVVAELPKQTGLMGNLPPLERAGFNLTPVAQFDIKARVLVQRVYSGDPVSDLSPVDLALGWGPMSDSKVLSHIEMSQGRRFFFWKTDAAPVPRSTIEQYSTNVHSIPATPEIEQGLRSIRPGDVIRLSGLLVNAHRPTDGYRWKTSTVRDDTGDGACEIVYITDLQVVSHVPGTSVAMESARLTTH